MLPCRRARSWVQALMKVPWLLQLCQKEIESWYKSCE